MAKRDELEAWLDKADDVLTDYDEYVADTVTMTIAPHSYLKAHRLWE